MVKFLIVPLIALLSGVSAADYRLLVSKPNCTTMAEFEANWKGYCPYFAPALAKHQTHGYAFFQAGDYQGKNNQTEALVYCTFKNQTAGAHEAIQYTSALAKTLGATPATSS